MEILNLPKEKNIIEFSDKELFLWLKAYVKGWASTGATKEHYDVVKVELVRRNNKRMLVLTIGISILTVVLIILTFILLLK